MNSFKKSSFLTGLAIFIIASIVFIMSAERTGSLWDCGEFILGAYKLQVVHPPGAPLFLLVGRLFAWVADVISSDPADIAFAVNIMSGLFTAGAATLAGMVTMMFGRIALVGRQGPTSVADNIALSLGGLVAGLTTAFATSIWFSAVEGEVYAMSTFFTALTIWAAVKFYAMEDSKEADKYLVLSLFVAGLSIGVHLLSLLTLPAIALLYYYKKNEKHTFLGVGLSLVSGMVAIAFIQKIIIAGIPGLWKNLDIFCVNTLGLPLHSGLIPTILIVAVIGYFLLRYAKTKGMYLVQLLTVSTVLIIIGFSTITTVVLRANADTPINMNVPSDATRLLPYINREQYGERPLLYGPNYQARPLRDKMEKEDRYGYVKSSGKYEKVDYKIDYNYAARDMMFFPRVGHSEGSRPILHDMYRDVIEGDHNGKPKMGYNLRFMMKYQLGWMYWRYFMWNFVGKQNKNQGYYFWDVKDGHWASGVKAIDDARTYNTDKLPDSMKRDQARNHYYFLPLIFGLLGLFFCATRSRKEFLALLMLFIITGIGIIIYSNQPPNEPRERDYVFVGSFMVFAMWVGMGVYFIYDILKNKVKMNGIAPAALAGVLVLTAPVIMGFQNFDDHSRAGITASRDYAHNFLESVDKNAIIFTYGDNDTYPLWYAQEVEGIRRDVRVVNLSLIAVDWYIDKLRNKVNDSAPLNLTLSSEAYRGKNRNQVFFYNPRNPDDEVMGNPVPAKIALDYIGEKENNVNGQTILSSKNLFIPINKDKVIGNPLFSTVDTSNISKTIPIRFAKNKRYILKDDLAIMDIVVSNIYDRPIYFATTVIEEKLLGLKDYMELEGLALRILPKKSKGDKSLGIYGHGSVNSEKMLDKVLHKWEYGNFDKEELFVDNNYMPAVQAMRMGMLRAAMDLTEKEKPKEAAQMANKFFEAFPHMNFAYDGKIIPFIEILIRNKDFESAKKHMRILAEESEQYMEFYRSLDQEALSSFGEDMKYTFRTVVQLLSMAKNVEDPAFEQEIKDKLQKYYNIPSKN